MSDGFSLLGPAEIRELASSLDLRPTKSRGQNFVIDPNTVRRIARVASLKPDDVVVEIGPGLGSLTLALLPQAARVVAVEIDDRLAGALASTVAAHAPSLASQLHVVHADALAVTSLPGPPPTAMVANLPYNVAVPVLLRMLEVVPTLRRVLVMVQQEVADRVCAPPGSRTYGVPSAKVAWYASAKAAGSVPRSVFWPVPNVDSGLVLLERRKPPAAVDRAATFQVIDAAFAQRRKTLRAALKGWAGSASAAEDLLAAAGVAPGARGEQLGISEFAAIAAARVRQSSA